MPQWLSELGSEIRHDVVKYVTSLHMPHWLPDIGKDVRDALVKLVVAGIAKSAWSKKGKVVAFFKKSNSQSTRDLSNPQVINRTASIASVFSDPVPVLSSIKVAFNQTPSPTPHRNFLPTNEIEFPLPVQSSIYLWTMTP